MSVEIVLTAAEVYKLNVKPGDVLAVKLVGDDFDRDTMQSLSEYFRKVFPNNKTMVFTLPTGSDIQIGIVEPPKEKSALDYAIDCSQPTAYCNSCSCGKKESILAAKAELENMLNTEKGGRLTPPSFGQDISEINNVSEEVQAIVDEMNNENKKSEEQS